MGTGEHVLEVFLLVQLIYVCNHRVYCNDQVDKTRPLYRL